MSVMTVTYLRGGLCTCSVVWLFVSLCFLTFLKFLMQLCKHFFKSFKNHSSYLLFLESFELRSLFS